MKHYSWKSIEDMFDALHKVNCEYIILRNYEEIDADNFYTSGHADIDFLTSDVKKFVDTVKAYPRTEGFDDDIHYKVAIKDTEVVIDLRSVGDGYYDTEWEKSILSNRIMLENRFYIADEENYYYSLVYHAILQKKVLADDYLIRLTKMASDLGLDANSEDTHLKQLNSFMRLNGYYYTYPFDLWVPLNVDNLDKKMLKKNANVKIRDFKLGVLKMGSKIKHIIK